MSPAVVGFFSPATEDVTGAVLRETFYLKFIDFAQELGQIKAIKSDHRETQF